MKINPINSGNIPFLKRKQVRQKPLIINGEMIKMIKDEEADNNELIPKLRMIIVREYGVIKGEEEKADGREEK